MKLKLNATIQAAGILLGRVPSHQMSYMRLLKLLYLADRRMLEKTGFPITFDRVIAMKNGPVLSETYDLIKGSHLAAATWSQYIATEGYHARLIQTPERGELSRIAISSLNAVQDDVSHLNDWALIEKLHVDLPEWIDNVCPNGGAPEINLHSILSAVGFDNNDAAIIEKEINAELELTKIRREE